MQRKGWTAKGASQSLSRPERGLCGLQLPGLLGSARIPHSSFPSPCPGKPLKYTPLKSLSGLWNAWRPPGRYSARDGVEILWSAVDFWERWARIHVYPRFHLGSQGIARPPDPTCAILGPSKGGMDRCARMSWTQEVGRGGGIIPPSPISCFALIAFWWPVLAFSDYRSSRRRRWG